MTTTRKAGRPRTDPATHRQHIHVTISPEAVRLAQRQAQALGLSLSAIIELAIRRLAAQEGER